MDMVMVESGLEMPMLASVPGAPSNEEEPPAPRTHFPETWLWDLNGENQPRYHQWVTRGSLWMLCPAERRVLQKWW